MPQALNPPPAAPRTGKLPLLAAFVPPLRSQRLRARRLSQAVSLASLLLVLGGCAGYRPQPLAEQPDSLQALRSLRVDTSSIALPRLAAQPIELDKPLPMGAVAALAVLDNPQLRLARDRLGVAQAQSFAAGLLPDPKFSATRDFPRHSPGATTSAYSYGLDFDLGSLLTRPAAEAAAREHLRSVNLDLLWQEWQTAAQAQLLYVRLASLQARRGPLLRELALVRQSLRRTRAAVAQGDVPRGDADALWLRLQSLRQRLDADQRSRLSLDASLHALLGLAPGVPLPLAGLPAIRPEASAQARAALARVADIRPDLLALRAGYASQEQTLRKAVLEQFPSVSVGLSRARDTSDVNTVGFGLSFNLPLFNGSRGRIAVARATRRELRDAYQLRLDQTQSEVEQALAQLRLLRRQQAALRAGLPALRATADAASQALADGSYTLQQAQSRQLALLDQQLALLKVQQQQAEQALSLELLTGAGLYRGSAAAAASSASSASSASNPSTS
ncbi:MAG: TolC family protein [Betaproteobacteria bacterium]|nr:TolC family protein [Betaproteobacteria bacterium]